MKRERAEVVIVGAGPAGLAAAASAARNRRQVLLLDDNPLAGGQIWRGGASRCPPAARRWFQGVEAAQIRLLPRSRVVAAPGTSSLLVERDEGPLLLHYDRLILATGARERFLPFPGWTLPGVTGVGGLQALVKGGLAVDGKRVVVAGSGPLLLAVAAYLRQQGARIPLVVEQAPWRKLLRFAWALSRYPDKIAQAAALLRHLRALSFYPGGWVVAAHGAGRVEEVVLQVNGARRTVPCDYLAIGYGLVPNLALPALLDCARQEGGVQVDEWQQTSRAGIFAAGEITGIGGVERALIEGQIAGFAAAGEEAVARQLFPARDRARRFAARLESCFALRPELRALARPETIVCRCEDVPYGALQAHDSWRSAKLQTRCGMGPCQGRVCGPAARFIFGWQPDNGRPPVTVARVGTLAATEEPAL